MRRANHKVVIDACVLVCHPVCELLLDLAERRLFLPFWSEEILQEVRRTHEKFPGWSPGLVASFQEKVRSAFPYSIIEGYRHAEASLQNDPKDRHVLAAAIKERCDLILTFNLRHFSAEALSPWGVEAQHPQDYLNLGRFLPRFAQKLLDDLPSS